jgi:glycosyltransferase involved in cell wall biosynthesis
MTREGSIRLLLVSAHYRPHVGGIERFTETLAEGLAGRGHDVAVVCCRSTGAAHVEDRNGVSIERVPATFVAERRLGVPYPLPLPGALWTVLRSRLANADIVHVQDAIYGTSVAALVLARRRVVPSVLTQHVAFVPQKSPLLNAAERAALATLGRASRLATLVATYNPTVAAWAERTWSLRDVRVLPVGVPGAAGADIDREQVRRSFDLPTDRFLALFAGRDVAKKGLDVFLAAGDPAYDLIAVSDRAGGDERGRLIPFMEHDRFGELMASADAFVAPSSAGEGFPLVLQEALAVGLPVVTTRHEGYEQYVSDQDVMYVERTPESLRRALLRLASDESLRTRLAERARAAGDRHFRPERFVSAYEDLYREALGRGSTA